MLTPTSILPIPASSRKRTPHATSPPEVNAPTTPDALLSLALTFPQTVSHVGVGGGTGSLALGSGVDLLKGLPHLPSLRVSSSLSPLLFHHLTASPALQLLQAPWVLFAGEKTLSISTGI